MSTVVEHTHHEPEDLLTMPDGDRFELVDGQLVERKMSKWSSYVAGSTFHRLRNHSDAHRLGWVYPEGTSYQCFPDDPKRVRRPDVSFIRLDRMSSEEAMSEGHVRIVPDLAVEVISPNDLAYDIDEKVDEYETAGVKLIWIVNPQMRTVRVHRADGTVRLLREKDELDGEQVFPGFRCRVGELFLPAAGSAAAMKAGGEVPSVS
jgi:Uma2 family endonuclease